jgi:hypothetical protein
LCVCDIQIARPCGFGAKWRNNKVSLRGVGKSRAEFFLKSRPKQLKRPKMEKRDFRMRRLICFCRFCDDKLIVVNLPESRIFVEG